MVDTSMRDKTEVRPMSDTDRQEVHRMHGQGMGVREIARHFNRAPSTVSRILRESRVGGGGGRAKTTTRPRMGGTATKGGTTAKARTTTMGRTTTKATTGRATGTATRTTGTTAGGATISRQELRSLEQRISRIENSLSRMSSMLQVSSRPGTPTTGAKAKTRRT